MSPLLQISGGAMALCLMASVAAFSPSVPVAENLCRLVAQEDTDGVTFCQFYLNQARCTALELCPNACCANRSGKPHFNAHSAHAYRYECSDIPEKDHVGEPTCPFCIGSTTVDFEKVASGRKLLK